ncbi:glutamine synthetase family protein [Prosthecomicrobium hirschii]|uniref:Glutamine synthetase n=1 Tax=Prosthecodimorpha hirschii TaxID=665126 RepID=A0A0P6W2I4_9HYPH|nr:glutamine synthetase family protein [Prosthecomicrobium hirschii]KPL51854.1 glutamine synthetase [Prosthecomicrobium hirschii]MCW1843820.1 glutamine synthetase family protein [Prosthecomicrobium hirschii]TPQ50093.1 glutamine synthetase [Prosthecomicrobium hirschii]
MGRIEIGPAAGDALDAIETGEVERFLEAHPETEAVEFLVTESNGVLRGKWAPAATIAKAFADGINFPFSMYGLDVWGREVMETGLHVTTGDRDGYCRAVPGSLRPVPWAARPTAQVLLTMHADTGEAFLGDPRHALVRVVERMKAAGYTPCCAVELEFYLLDPKAPPMADGMPAPVYRATAGPTPQNMYAMSDLSDFSSFFSDIWAYGKAQGLPIDTMVSEAAPGQFEVNLKHRADAVAAADDAVMLKRLVCEVARRHGLKATFMPKPFMDVAGSGLHLHVSLLDRFGHNVFADPMIGERRLGQAIAGLLETMQASTLLFVSSWNGFRRLQPGSYAPTTASWGHNNRSVGVRVPASSDAARRLEHRIAGADANPYLVTAAVLAGMLEGLERELTPPPPVVRNAYEEPVPALPASMAEAITLFERSDFVRRMLGVEYRSLIAHLKRAEAEAFAREITPLERLTYL